MIGLNQLSMAYGGRLLFYDVDLFLNDNMRYALVGANGTGKSTLLRLLTCEETPTEGSIAIPKDATIGWLKQEQFRYEDSLIVDVVIQGKPQLWQAMMEKEEIYASETLTDKQGYRLAELEEIIAHADGYTANAFAEKLLIGLGIQPKYHYQPLRSLSGGYKLRVLLAQALFQQPTILLLDEPTNHLDILSIHWLEKYLKNEFNGLLVFISHDKEFIDRLADKILDIDYGEVREYSGKYEKFLAEKVLIEEQKLQLQKSLEDKITQMKKFVDRFGAKASKAKQAQSRVKMLEKLELQLPDIKHSSRVAPHFHFKPHRASGKQVLKVKDLAKSFEDNILFNRVNFSVGRGEKVAIAGANGIGKSTLIKTLLGQLKADAGEFEWGHETHISYFSQDHHELLNEHMNALQWLSNHVTNCPEQQLRKALAHVLFTKDEVEKDILSLSGGEAARLLLAKIMLENSNILILDEPTNHLDIETTDSLAKALADYTGTLIIVSHNRYFINKVANRVLFISRDKPLQDFRGRYQDFEVE